MHIKVSQSLINYFLISSQIAGDNTNVTDNMGRYARPCRRCERGHLDYRLIIATDDSPKRDGGKDTLTSNVTSEQRGMGVSHISRPPVLDGWMLVGPTEGRSQGE